MPDTSVMGNWKTCSTDSCNTYSIDRDYPVYDQPFWLGLRKYGVTWK